VHGVLDQLDTLVLNAVEAVWLSGTETLEAASDALAALARRTCISDGRSLGAGDAFLAGLAAALADGDGWDAACERGQAVAGAWVASRA
jgi:sugar/nucleoside kinase (ribokinase family)